MLFSATHKVIIIALDGIQSPYDFDTLDIYNSIYFNHCYASYINIK